MLLEFVDNFKTTGRGIATIVGLDQLRPRSHAKASMRISAPVLAQERAEALTALARISLTYVSPEAPDPIASLERLSLNHVGPIAGPENHPVRQGLVRGVTYLARKTAAASKLVRGVLVRDEEISGSDPELSRTSLSRFERVGAPTEMEKLSLSSSDNPKPIPRDSISLTALQSIDEEDEHPITRAFNHILRSLARKTRAMLYAIVACERATRRAFVRNKEFTDDDEFLDQP